MSFGLQESKRVYKLGDITGKGSVSAARSAYVYIYARMRSIADIWILQISLDFLPQGTPEQAREYRPLSYVLPSRLVRPCCPRLTTFGTYPHPASRQDGGLGLNRQTMRHSACQYSRGKQLHRHSHRSNDKLHRRQSQTHRLRGNRAIPSLQLIAPYRHLCGEMTCYCMDNRFTFCSNFESNRDNMYMHLNISSYFDIYLVPLNCRLLCQLYPAPNIVDDRFLLCDCTDRRSNNFKPDLAVSGCIIWAKHTSTIA